MSMKSVLLIHEDVDCIVAFCGILTRAGNIVIPKTSGESALSLIKEGATIDLVILAQKLTEDDKTFLARLKQLVPSVPFMVVENGATATSCLN